MDFSLPCFFNSQRVSPINEFHDMRVASMYIYMCVCDYAYPSESTIPEIPLVNPIRSFPLTIYIIPLVTSHIYQYINSFRWFPSTPMTPQSAQGQEWHLRPPERHRQNGRPVRFAADCGPLWPTASQQGLRLPIVSGRQGWGEGCVMMCGGLTKKNRLNKLNMDKRLERWSLNRDVLDSVKPVLKPAKARHIDVMKVLLGQEWAPPEEDASAEV